MCGAKDEHFTNKDIERGNELEPYGRCYMKCNAGNNVYEVGGIENSDYEGAWVSPDGLIGDDGGIEIKARNDKKHFNLIMGDEKDIPVDQIQMSLLVSGRKWWDFVSINTDFSKPIFIKRIYPDEKIQAKIKLGLERGVKLIKENITKYNDYETNNKKSIG